MDRDYNHFRDSILVAVADAHTGSDSQTVHLNTLGVLGTDENPTWLEAVGPDLKALGYGLFIGDRSDAYFSINGAGLSRAAEIRAERKPLSTIDKLASERTQRLLNVGAFVVSIISLIVAISALVVAGR